MRLRAERNEMIKTQLLAGGTVSYRNSGWSLMPRVKPNDLCSFIPVRHASQVEVGTIVFCQIPATGRIYAQVVGNIQWCSEEKKPYYWIRNGKDLVHRNGWCWLSNIFGSLCLVDS